MKITHYKKEFAQDFKDLNIAWLEKYFYAEPYDLKVLGNPQEHILDRRGNIFFAVENDKVYGTVALMPTAQENVFELTKMAVKEDTQGKGIGHLLIEYCISFAKSNNYQELILYSHKKLENAVHIYRKYGFKEIPLEKSSHYERSDIKMELVF